MEKHCLIIDNEDQASSIETIVREGRKQGLQIVCHQFNVGSTKREDLLTVDKKIDINKVINSFKEEFKGVFFHLIAFDWDLDDSGVNGIDLINHFDAHRLRSSRIPKLLYSGILKDEMQIILDKYKKGSIEFSKAWEQINTLIKIDICNFSDRTNYEQAIIDVLKKIEEPVDSIIEAKLREYPDLVFKSAYPGLEGKKLSEVADIISKDGPQGLKFKKEIIEQTIAYIIDINKD